MSVPVRVYSEAELIERLTPLAASGGSLRLGVTKLREKGITISERELDRIREHHSGLYQALASDFSSHLEERLAQDYREVAASSTRLARKMVDEMEKKLDAEGLPDNPEKQLTAVTKVIQTTTDKLLSITGRPVAGQAIDPHEAARELVRMGVFKIADADADAEEITDDEDQHHDAA